MYFMIVLDEADRMLDMVSGKCICFFEFIILSPLCDSYQRILPYD